jgi:phosphohistidine phosphatase
MILYMVRHASAGESKSDPALDRKRPLDKSGIEQCGVMGRALAAAEVHVELVLSSPLKRATQTAALVSNEIGYDGKLLLEPSLEPDGNYEKFREVLRQQRHAEAIMVVGHNPSLPDFMGRLIGQRGRARIDLKKGAVARLDVDGENAELVWCLTPKVVRAVQEAAISSSRPKSSRK